MNFEPQKFFIGLMDFFTILLPGALLTYLLMGEVGPVVLGDRYAKLARAEGWAVFLFASYLFGHLIFLLGAWLDELYDWARRNTLNTQIKRLAHHNCLLPWLVRALIWLVFKRERNLAVDRAGRIKAQALKLVQAKKGTINTFQWCKAWLNAESQPSLSVIQRFEADAKFFRSFTVVLLFLLVLGSWPGHWLLPGVHPAMVVPLLLLALWRYMEQRFKSTNQAYWSVITLTARNGKLPPDQAMNVAIKPTHAGGVVFKKRWRGPAKYLLVEAKDDPDQWVLPKGHVEQGEHHRETAVREVHEETGTWACVVTDMGDATWTVNGSVVTTRFFLMRAVGHGLQQEKDRRHKWLPLQKAVAKASHIETRELLQAAEQRRSRPANASRALATPTPST